jgi:hypothetical protein
MDQFNHSILEADIERLSREIAEKKNLPEYKNLPARELIKQTIQPMIGQDARYKIQATSEEKKAEETFLPDYLKELPAETKLQVAQLVDLTFHQGIEKVVSRARRANPFILDAFHDALADKLYEELKKRELI